jgi:hypothetical protein
VLFKVCVVHFELFRYPLAVGVGRYNAFHASAQVRTLVGVAITSHVRTGNINKERHRWVEFLGALE